MGEGRYYDQIGRHPGHECLRRRRTVAQERTVMSTAGVELSVFSEWSQRTRFCAGLFGPTSRPNRLT